MITIFKTARKARAHVNRNKATYAVGAVAVGMFALQQSNRKAFYAFLIEKGIDPMEYYNPEFYAELHPVV